MHSWPAWSSATTILVVIIQKNFSFLWPSANRDHPYCSDNSSEFIYLALTHRIPSCSQVMCCLWDMYKIRSSTIAWHIHNCPPWDFYVIETNAWLESLWGQTEYLRNKVSNICENSQPLSTSHSWWLPSQNVYPLCPKSLCGTNPRSEFFK